MKKHQIFSKAVQIVAVLVLVMGLGYMTGAEATKQMYGNIRNNVITDFNSTVESPNIDNSAHIHPMASVIGNVEIGRNVMVSPFASARGDEGQPIHVGDDSNLQDGVVLHALETEEHGKENPARLVIVDGKKYAIYIGERVSLAHQSHVHGPAYVGDDTFIGMKAMVFNAKVGKNCVLEPGAIVIGVQIPDGRYVKAGQTVTDQNVADRLPIITDDYAYKNTNKAVVHVNTSLAKGYNGTSHGLETSHNSPETNHNSPENPGEFFFVNE